MIRHAGFRFNLGSTPPDHVPQETVPTKEENGDGVSKDFNGVLGLVVKVAF